MVCGSRSYRPDTQCCCDRTVHSVPLKDCQCCGTQAYRRNEAKPDTCTAPCGTSTYHYGTQATQLCCNGTTVVNLSTDLGIARHQICCGQRVMNTQTHECCNDDFSIKQKDYGCCNKTPYHLDTMKCYWSTGTVHMRSRTNFSSQDFCDRNLPEWDTEMPLPSARNTSMIHVRGLPQDCSLRVKSRQIEIVLYPFVVVNQHLDQDCDASDTLLLVIKLQANQTCSSEEKLKASLHGVALDIFTRKHVVCSKASEDMPVLRLKDGKRAVIYLSKHAGSILAKSLQ
ncbi:hypothetical protein V1264_018126 [Littorina saxatilis]|uniref:Galaxin-like repeats domain-containing protein n=2 Tax=Littorina saxatilis TaxID=31220 RepID=A0AAN9BBV4_9CAEN